MCGIFILLDGSAVDTARLQRLFNLVGRRGPDYESPAIDHSDGSLVFKLKASVLHLRGDQLQEQPVVDDSGNILLFNGQIYLYSRHALDPHESDTYFLVQELKKCTSTEEIARVFANIEGPFAFIYWSRKLKTLLYGRDLFGRKSLCSLSRLDISTPVIVSSIADENLESKHLKWSEVSCTGLHCVDFSDFDQPNSYTFHWDLDRVYPKSAKCGEPPSLNPADKSIPVDHICPLNYDLRPSECFDGAILQQAIRSFEEKFLKAVKSRFEFNNKTCLTCRRSGTNECNHAKVAVAFSGGVDSTIIALALDKIVDRNESIDLITVAFKPNSPDRKSVGEAFKELMKLCPNRNWRLILSDISIPELQQMRVDATRNLILPCDTVFDDAIGCACWFVGRASGRTIDRTTNRDWLTNHFESFLRYDPLSRCVDPENTMAYISPASMLYAGSSIDEQLGGYSSHRAAWSKLGPRGLIDEISFQMRRLSSRNLGRDDRVYCDHGRDLKLPFLDFDFVSFLNQLPVGLKMNLDEPLDVGPKKILRLLALQWGLESTSRRVKRAMQFGTRIANLENSKEKGKDVCARLTN